MIKKLWFLVIALLIVHLIIQYVFYLRIDFKSTSEWLYFFIDLNANMLLIYLLGGTLAFLTAFIPFRKKSYWEKLKLSLPLLMSLTLFVVILSFAYLVFWGNQKGYSRRNQVAYETIATLEHPNCLSVRTGKFETEGCIIERTTNKQLETDARTGKTIELNIHWINDCEYTLTTPNDSLDVLYIKITEIADDYYRCYASNKKYPNQPAMFFEVKRIHDK